jgi:phosphoglycolate phosphatase-like HAD superfamily hydrolase
LNDYGIQDLFPEERLIDKETGVSKAAHLQYLHQQLNLEYAQMTFMDDKVNHLDAVAPLGVRCALATWGYNSEREHHLAS